MCSVIVNKLDALLRSPDTILAQELFWELARRQTDHRAKFRKLTLVEPTRWLGRFHSGKWR